MKHKLSVQAKWRNKIFGVSPDEIKTVGALSLSCRMKAETNDDLEFTPQTNERGLEPANLNITVKLDNAAGVDVRKEIEDWQELVEKTDYFYLAGRRLGPFYKLYSADAAVSILDDFGIIRSAELSLSFLECVNTEGVKDKSGPKIEDKLRMKPGNVLLANAKKTGFDIGAKVRIVGKYYTTGEHIPDWVKDNKYTISQTKPDKVLLQPVNSWVYISDITLVV